MYKDQRYLCQHLHEAVLMSGNHSDKIGEIGLKLALVEKRWLAIFMMICKLGLVQGRAKVMMPMPRGNCLIVCPLPNADIEEWKIQAQQKYLPQPLPHAKALRHKSSTSSENKEAKQMSESRTTLRNNSKTLERCENNFAWHCWRKKGKYFSDAGALHKRTWCILNGIILFWSRSQLRTMYILTNILYYFDLFYNWKRWIYLWLHYCKLCNRLFLNQQDKQ